jgi:hypothetical protein
MLQNNNIAGIATAEFFIRINLKAMSVQGSYFIILILEINGAVAILKRPDERKRFGSSFSGFRAQL